MPVAGPVAGAVAGAVVSDMLSDDGGGRQQSAQASAHDQMLAQISKEEWDLYKEEAIPMLRELVGMRTTKDRTAEEVELAASGTKSAFSTARQALERRAGQTRNPGDPGYSAILAPTYMDEAAAVSTAITDARRKERARVEDTNWGRTLQAIGAYQRLPQDASANLQAAAAGQRSAAALDQRRSEAAGARTAQGAYGGAILGRAANAWFSQGAAPAQGHQYGADDLYDFGGESYAPQAGMDDFYSFRDGGAVRPRYADGGEVRGPGTGVSDSIPARVRPGSYILSTDTVRAIGTDKIHKMMEKAGLRPGVGGDDPGGRPVRLSNGEYQIPPEAVQHYGEEFFNKLQQKYHRPVADDGAGMANGGAIRKRALPKEVEEAIFRAMPDRALGKRRV